MRDQENKPFAEPAGQLDSFGSDADLIEWLDKFYCAEASGAVTNQKWPPAQYAIAALRQYALPAEPKKAVSSMDRAELQVEVFELRAQLAALVDPDYTLAPIDPTEAMVHAAEDIPAPRPFGKVYRAMLEAAPKADSLIAARGRAEGGNTCNEGSSKVAGNALTDEAKDADGWIKPWQERAKDAGSGSGNYGCYMQAEINDWRTLATDIAGTKNRTATDAQFARHLQGMAAEALGTAAIASHIKAEQAGSAP